MITDPVEAQLEILPESALVGSVEIDSPSPLVLPRSSEIELPLRVANRGTAAWPVFSDYGFLQVNLLYIWWSNYVMLQDVGGLIDLPRNLPIGGSTS